MSDFNIPEDFIGLINLGVTEANWAERITQSLLPASNSLELNLDGSALATLSGVTSEMGRDRFYLA